MESRRCRHHWEPPLTPDPTNPGSHWPPPPTSHAGYYIVTWYDQGGRLAFTLTKRTCCSWPSKPFATVSVMSRPTQRFNLLADGIVPSCMRLDLRASCRLTICKQVSSTSRGRRGTNIDTKCNIKAGFITLQVYFASFCWTVHRKQHTFSVTLVMSENFWACSWAEMWELLIV